MTPAARLLPLRLSRWWPLFELAGRMCQVDPMLLAAICDRESLGGEALTPRGPEGTGDSEARKGHHLAGPDGLPGDGRGGWGRGLMQVDFGAFPAFCAGNGWVDPAKNIAFGAGVLARALAAFNGEEACAVAAYNAGVRRVREAVSVLTQPVDPKALLAACDSVTTGLNYASDVLKRRDSFTIPRLTPEESV